jgi:hypothetical protein
MFGGDIFSISRESVRGRTTPLLPMPGPTRDPAVVRRSRACAERRNPVAGKGSRIASRRCGAFANFIAHRPGTKAAPAMRIAVLTIGSVSARERRLVVVLRADVEFFTQPLRRGSRRGAPPRARHHPAIRERTPLCHAHRAFAALANVGLTGARRGSTDLADDAHHRLLTGGGPGVS